MKFKRLIITMLAIALITTPVSSAGVVFSKQVQADETTVAETQNSETTTVIEDIDTEGMQSEHVLSGTVSNKQPKLKASGYTTPSTAAKTVRTAMINHEAVIDFYIKSKSTDAQAIYDKFLDYLYAETSDSSAGDYLRWGTNHIDTYYVVYSVGKTNYYTYTMNIDYYITLEQQQKFDKEITKIIKNFNITSSTTTYEKIKKAYDYVCKNVTYDESSDNMKYTAYKAVFSRTAVCQGYALLIYKLLRNMGISTRLIAGHQVGSSEGHGWNIAKLGSLYYNMDSTWDSQYYHAGMSYKYFLKGDSFASHVRWPEYATNAFYRAYPMCANAYGGAAVASANTQRARFVIQSVTLKKVNKKKATWKKLAGVAGYQIKYSYNKKFKGKKTKTAKTKKTYYKFKKKNLKKKKTYYVKVRAYKKFTGKVAYTKFSKVKKFKNK